MYTRGLGTPTTDTTDSTSYTTVCYYYYCIDKHTYLHVSKSTQSAAGLKALKSAANGRYLMCKSITLLFPFTVQKYIYSPVGKVHAGSFHVSVIHRNLTWTTGSLTCVHDHDTRLVCHRSHQKLFKVYLDGVAKQQEVSQGVPWTVSNVFNKLSAGLQKWKVRPF